ncbi:hypothetical protein F4802DRAFT_284745 [Xylaria palmicola]|nr:hypothetical protein F4802DRAFT_284745 [Xylaria palmicola]
MPPTRPVGPSAAAVAHPLSPLKVPSASGRPTLPPAPDPQHQQHQQHQQQRHSTNDDPADEPSPPSFSLHAEEPADFLAPRSPSHRNSSGRRQSSLTAHEYINAIYRHSLRSPLSSSFPGRNYIDIANWLLPHTPGTRPTNHDPSAHDPKHCLAALHQLGHEQNDRTQLLAQSEVSALEALLKPLGASKKGSLLFLRGYLPPAWIAELGSRFRIDPEFFARHLDFLGPATYRNSFSTPSLVTTDNNIIHAYVTTILTNDSVYPRAKSGFAARHRETRDLLSKYRRQFWRSANYGDSVVREYTVLSPEYAVIEQRISICVATAGESWIGLVWMDTGRSIESSPPGPWTADFELDSSRAKETVLPTIQHHQKMTSRRIGAFEAENSLGDAGPSPYGQLPTRAPQSLSILPLEYPSLLSAVGLARRASSDVFHALIPTFAHAAFSEVAFLNLLAGLIEELIAPLPIDEFRSDCFERLQEYEICLERHASQLRHSLRTVRVLRDSGAISRPPYNATQSQGDMDPRIRVRRDEARAHKESPLSLEFHLPEASTYTVTGIVEDFEDLLDRCTRLRTRAATCMSTEMNRAMILESRKAIEQSERLKKLTLLATYFIPLTFTASVFGMNFKLFGQGDLPLWWYIVIAVPLILLTHMISTADLAAWKQRSFIKYKNAHHLLRRKPQQDTSEGS